MLAALPVFQWSMVYVSHVGSVWVLSVHVGLPLSIRKGWVLLLKRGYSGPPIQSSALGRSNVLSALMHSRCPFSWKKERQREKWEGGQRERIGSYNPQSRPLAVSQPIALVWGILAGAPGALCCWVSFQNKSDCIYHFLSLALFPSHVISRQTAKYRVAKGVGGPLWNCYSYLTQYSYGTLVLVADFNDCSFLRSFWVFHPSLYLISYLGQGCGRHILGTDFPQPPPRALLWWNGGIACQPQIPSEWLGSAFETPVNVGNTSPKRCPAYILIRCLNHLNWLFSVQRSSSSTLGRLECPGSSVYSFTLSASKSPPGSTRVHWMDWSMENFSYNSLTVRVNLLSLLNITPGEFNWNKSFPTSMY